MCNSNISKYCTHKYNIVSIPGSTTCTHILEMLKIVFRNFQIDILVALGNLTVEHCACRPCLNMLKLCYYLKNNHFAFLVSVL